MREEKARVQKRSSVNWTLGLKGKVAALLVLSLACACAAGCDEEELAYLLQQAPGQAALLLKRAPFERVLDDPELEPEAREKLEFVLDVKNYGVERVGLARSKSYEILVRVEREAVTWNLTAAEPLSMTPVTWEFPVAGEVPYLGFFKKKHAEGKANELEEQGFEVYLRVANAYSMLGIVSDPLYSPLLKYSKAYLAELVLHEMLHGTVFIKGKMEFNENLALFVGEQGAYNYLSQRFGPDSEEAMYVLYSNHDAQIFSKEIMKLYGALDRMYKSPLSEREKLAKKEEIIEAHKVRFREEVLPRMKTGRYRGWPERDINNATIISRTVYYHDLGLYRDMYEAMDQDLKALVGFFKHVAGIEGVAPEAYARDWLREQGEG